mgnify:CR=1 FL=1
MSVSLQTDLKEQFARTDRRWFDTLLVSMLTPSENDTSRYEAIIRIRRDRSKPLLYFAWSTPRLQRYILRIKRA